MRFPNTLARLIRVIAGYPEPSASPDKSENPDIAESNSVDPFSSIGVFGPRDSEKLLNNFESIGIRFQIEMDEATKTGRRGGILIDRETRILVHDDDLAKAQEAIAEVQPIVLRN